MSFGQSIQMVFRKYAEFSGRASRSEFWWFALFSFLVSGATSSIGLGVFWFFAVIVPSLAVSVRRLRDAGLGWGWLFFALLPVVGLVVLAILLAQPSRPESVVTTEVPPTRVPPKPQA